MLIDPDTRAIIDESQVAQALAVGDVDGDGVDEVLAWNAGLELHDWSRTSSFVPRWHVDVPSRPSSSFLLDLDGDGAREAVLYVAGAVVAVDLTGPTVLSRQPLTTTPRHAFVADLDGDGQRELVDGGPVRVRDALTGTRLDRRRERDGVVVSTPGGPLLVVLDAGRIRALRWTRNGTRELGSFDLPTGLDPISFECADDRVWMAGYDGLVAWEPLTAELSRFADHPETLAPLFDGGPRIVGDDVWFQGARGLQSYALPWR